jgi:hypothetical protein
MIHGPMAQDEDMMFHFIPSNGHNTENAYRLVAPICLFIVKQQQPIRNKVPRNSYKLEFFINITTPDDKGRAITEVFSRYYHRCGPSSIPS